MNILLSSVALSPCPILVFILLSSIALSPVSDENILLSIAVYRPSLVIVLLLSALSSLFFYIYFFNRVIATLGKFLILNRIIGFIFYFL